MNKDLLQKYKKMLEKEKAETTTLLERIATRVGNSSKYTPRVADFGDDVTEFEDEEADEAEEFGARVGITHVLSDSLEAIENALEKIKKDTYGICVSCEKGITHDVLRARPASELCKICKKAL